MTQAAAEITASRSDRRAVSPEKTLRRLFLTLFLRGRSSRGLQKQKAPKSIGQKLALTLALYGLIGLFAFAFARQPVFALAVYLHAMTFVFLGMFVASSAGEVLFNKEEADILLHRPIEPGALLWAKIRVLVEVSLWLAAAFNLGGFVVGVAFNDGGWPFLFAHATSTVLEAMFCTGSVIMVYQLCLRWFGRERLDGLMTASQIIIAVAAVLAGQVLPQIVFRLHGVVNFGPTVWWMALLPPAWFAGFDDAVAGSGSASSWLLAAFALVAAAGVLWIAFSKLASDYEAGLQKLGENISPRRSASQKGGSRRWIDFLIDLPPLRWWLRDPISRASFLLTAAYLARDRDVKLRVYPAMAPILVLPVVMLVNGFSRGGLAAGGFTVSFLGSYTAIIPLMAVSILQYSQQWQASDVFHLAPISGPARICDGGRRAVLCFLGIPVLGGFGLIICLLLHDWSQMLLLLPGAILVPIYAVIPNIGGHAIPLSRPTEESKSATRGLDFFGAILAAMAISGIAAWSVYGGWFWWFILVEVAVAAPVYMVMRVSLSRAAWPSLE